MVGVIKKQRKSPTYHLQIRLRNKFKSETGDISTDKSNTVMKGTKECPLKWKTILCSRTETRGTNKFALIIKHSLNQVIVA